MSAASPIPWTQPGDVRVALLRRWEQGLFLSALVRDENHFPYRLPLRTPDSRELAERFDEVRAWITGLRAEGRLRLEEREFTHRVLGNNRVPEAAWVDSLENLAELIGRGRELRRFREVVSATRERLPHLLDWLAAQAMQALRLADEWPHLLAVVAWVRAHPRPGVYLRQMDLPGVHTKFVEAHRKVLIELLDLTLPPGAIDAAANGASGFNRRYGFLDKPERIRFRLLDATTALFSGAQSSDWIADNPARSFSGTGVPLDSRAGGPTHLLGRDLTLDADAFARLHPDVAQVFITENEINYLAFPDVPGSLLVFGAGYGFAALADAGWLQRCRVRYWGDLDTHGFAILDQLRAHLPHAESLLMDRETLLRFRDLWGAEPSPTHRLLPRLTLEESELYQDLCANRLAPRLRLEQERIGFEWLCARLADS